MRVGIVGAGNGGHAMAAELTIGGHDVTLCTRNPEKLENLKISGGIEVHGAVGNEKVTLSAVTDQVSAATQNADIVVIPVPGMMQESYLEMVLPEVERQPVWLAPGTGGSLLAAQQLRRLAKSDVTMIETVTLPYAARMTGAARVGVSALFNLRYASFPARCVDEVTALLGELYRPTRPSESLITAPNVLDTAVNNMNCIIHPQPCLMNMGWIEARQRKFSVYSEGMSPSVLGVLHAIDGERQSVISALGFEVFSIDELYAHLGTGPIYRKSMDLGENAERFYDRFFTEDVPVGLITLQSLGDAFGVDTPLIDATITYSNALYDTNFGQSGRTVSRLGLGGMSMEEMLDYLINGGENA